MTHPGGRPTDYTQAKVDYLCAELATGKSLRTVCLGDDMPHLSTVFCWLRKYPEFAEQYGRAKKESAEAWAEEILDISDNGANDWIATHDPENPGYKSNGEAIQRSKLRVDSRKWLMSKLVPKKYGEKIQQELTGANGGPLEGKWTIEVIGAGDQKKAHD